MIILLDHHDSFVHTLARYVTELGGTAQVVAADDANAASIAAFAPTHVILAPGPRTPRDCPLAIELVRTLTIPILGVCLGHQCIAAAFGATVRRARHPQHGLASMITHNGGEIFEGIPTPFRAARYHSLEVDRETLGGQLIVTATADDGTVMGIRHVTRPIEGVQFHPESILTEWGYRLIGNFLGVATPATWRGADSAKTSDLLPAH